jgi:hypothetical protein
MKKRKETWKLKVMLMNQLNIYFFKSVPNTHPHLVLRSRMRRSYIFSPPLGTCMVGSVPNKESIKYEYYIQLWNI